MGMFLVREILGFTGITITEMVLLGKVPGSRSLFLRKSSV
jgi:hypothetical protein